MADGSRTSDIFVKRLRSADREGEIRLLAVNRERILVAIGARHYLIFTPQTTRELSLSKIQMRVGSWPTLYGHSVAGHIILARLAGISQAVSTGRHQLPPMTAVVGRWGEVNEVFASVLDHAMLRILELAGISDQRVSQLRAQIEEERPARDQTTTGQTDPVPSARPVTKPLPRRLAPGSRVDAYELVYRLGRGQSAEVWKAKVIELRSGVDLETGSIVAIKIYAPSIIDSFQPLRIQREFTIAANLIHENLALVHDLVLSPSRPFHSFMVMEFIDGPTLKTLIEQRKTLDSRTAHSVGLQIFSALAELHSAGAIHRDVKAANIMVVSQAKGEIRLKLLDLGIVSLMTDGGFTAPSVFLGSKHSAPLEQLTGETIDERTDIYGAGSVLYHAIKGVPMYHGAGPEGAIVRRMLSAPERLSVTTHESATRRLVDFINRCIEVDPWLGQRVQGNV